MDVPPNVIDAAVSMEIYDVPDTMLIEESNQHVIDPIAHIADMVPAVPAKIGRIFILSNLFVFISYVINILTNNVFNLRYFIQDIKIFLIYYFIKLFYSF